MKKLMLLILFGLFVSNVMAQITSYTSFYDKADAFFSENVVDGKVDYTGIQNDPSSLIELTEFIAVAPNPGKSDDQKAFLINAYNLYTIQSIIEKGIPESPLKVEAFWDEKSFNVFGEILSLNQIEKERLLPVYNDARLHFVLVCAALGCPQLQSFAYRPDVLNDQMEDATKKSLNSDSFIRVDSSNRKVEVSEIFTWYEGDFLAESESVLDYINKYRESKIPARYTVGKYQYDWNLNIQ